MDLKEAYSLSLEKYNQIRGIFDLESKTTKLQKLKEQISDPSMGKITLNQLL